MHIDVSVVIVSYNTANLLKECINALRQSLANLKYEIIIVDNASVDGSSALVKREFPDCRIVENDTNVGFGRANNQALAWVNGRYVLLVNTDAFVAPDTVETTVAHMDSHKHCGILGVRLVDRDGALQPSARFFPTPWNMFLQRTGLARLFKGVRLVDDMDWDHASVRHCDWVPGCYYLIRKEVIDEVGLFDPRYFLYYEEIDHCFAAKRAGWEVVYFPDTTVIHIGGESAKTGNEISRIGRQVEALQIESELLYFRKNHGRASVWLNVLLTTLGNIFIVFKQASKRKFPPGFGVCAKRIALVWALFRRTDWGTRATR